MKWRITFRGRPIGSIGLAWHTSTVTFDAPTRDDAKLLLYETHEHISILSVAPIEDHTNDTQQQERPS